MSAPALDRDRLLADLRAAAEVAWLTTVPFAVEQEIRLHHMGVAWRVVAAAIEDGEYDAAQRPSEHSWGNSLDFRPPIEAKVGRGLHKPWCRTWVGFECDCGAGAGAWVGGS